MNRVESFLTANQEKTIIKAIRTAEKHTSGEIRVHIESKTEKPTLERAKEVFLYLKMDQTKQRNGILLYVAVESREFAILGDHGINQVIPKGFWEEEKKMVLDYFAKKQFEEGLVKVIKKVGEKLNEFFPYEKEDTNELSDTISKG
jgi:uncharacterized membrane protein